jgi:hypothetical protein
MSLSLPDKILLSSMLFHSNILYNTRVVYHKAWFFFVVVIANLFSMKLYTCGFILNVENLLTVLYKSLILIIRRRRSIEAPCSSRSSKNWTESCRSASFRALSNWTSYFKFVFRLKIYWIFILISYCPLYFSIFIENIWND